MTSPSPHDTLERIQALLNQGAVPTQLIGELLPRTHAEAMTWARRLSGWDEYRGQFPDQAIALARVVSRHTMRAFDLILNVDGRVIERPQEGFRRQTPAPSLTFRLAVRGEEVRVAFTHDYFPHSGTDLFYFVSPHEPAQPYCLSESGYWSHFAPHDAVVACGGPQAYAALCAEARLRGEEKAFDTAFEGERPETTKQRCKKAPPPDSPAAKDSALPAVLGEHTAQVIEEQEVKKSTDRPPRQGLLF